MTAEQFAYWLQGFAELSAEPPTAEQWQSIQEHLQTVFLKVTPPVRPHPGIPYWPISADDLGLGRAIDKHTRAIC